MAKPKTVFFCQNCGAQSPKWMGKCTACGEWNTLVEEVVSRDKAEPSDGNFRKHEPQPVRLNEIVAGSEQRRSSGNHELDRVLGGGLVDGSLVLMGGEPGIGKSTLMMQVALGMKDIKVLYVSGEESEQQIRMRADRLGLSGSECYILTETVTQNIFRHIEQVKPDLLIIDSIQTLQTQLIDSSAGSISQIRETASEMQRFAKTTGVPVILIGHITKDGNLAGPKILEHMVDTVLQFEGDRNYGFRILRTSKNRFGSASELGIFEMGDTGLREVLNPSEILLAHRDESVSGVAVACTIEGLRPMLIEVQALVSTAAYGTPQRSATGFDTKRLNMLLAVLEKRCGFRIGAKDVFLNIAGGLRVDDPAIDLAVVSAILSSNQDISADRLMCFAGEIGLSGEIRPVNRIAQRIAEAEKLGFHAMVVSQHNLKGYKPSAAGTRIMGVNRVEDVYKLLFGV